MTPNARPAHRGRSLAAIVVACLACLPSLAAGIECPVPDLPRPAGDLAAFRAGLEARGLWHASGDPARTPPPDPQVGDSWLWYVWDLGGFPVANLKPATVRGRGDHCYVVVDDDEWNVSMDQADVDRIIHAFDAASVGSFPTQGIWDLETAHFGDPPNPLDGLDRVFLFYYRFDISADGFFWIYDQFPDGTQDFASNECDVVYLATDSGQPASDYMIGVMAHEFQHMIHFARDADETTWVDEGLGEFAMWLYGRPDTISGFNTNPDDSLVLWGSQWADYIQTYLWSLYCYERYGGQPLIWNLIHNPSNGMIGYQQTLDGLGHLVSTQDVYDDWSVANFLDDPTVAGGQYGYQGDDLPPFTAWRTHTTFPASGSSGVQAHATDYVRLVAPPDTPTVTFNGADTRQWRVSLIARDPLQPKLVVEVPLDAAGDGSLSFGAAAGYQEVVISIANVHLTSSGIYTYSVEVGSTAIGEVVSPAPAVRAYPNPFNPRTELIFTLPAAGPARLRLYTADGSLVRTLVDDADLPAGEHRSAWTGRDEAGRGLPSGTYLARLETAAGVVIEKVMLVR
ncbi:MAG TPA: T9SS type A sorting domain-containing protein [Candidatus Krumholzibacteria bacterium]|nr:T9SS type A sorting domain-containing protein [Candidatus Krumholzibacteria bacterium]HPD72246.1 T9SS type A sorting domain-containing protein [Candidatus Krumholzibacteria bacterium]HRY40822.1 T9SS type A sorting domain-containing protein [Candidatus Krumholzibacteria bacterium]